MNIKITEGEEITCIFDVTRIEIYTVEESDDPSDYYGSPDSLIGKETLFVYSPAFPEPYSTSSKELVKQMKQKLNDDENSDFVALRS